MTTIDSDLDAIIIGHRVRLLDYDGGRAPAYYIAVRVTCGRTRCLVGCMVGAPKSMWGTVRASGAGVRPVCTAWTVDASDMADVPDGWHDAVRDALCAESYRLFCAADALADDDDDDDDEDALADDDDDDDDEDEAVG